MFSLRKCVSAFAAGLLTLGPTFVNAENHDYQRGLSEEQCSYGDYASGLGTGCIGGYGICLSKHNEGLHPRKLEFEGDWQAIRGLTVTWTTGTTRDVGSINYRGDKTRKASIEWNPVEDRITQLEIWTTARAGTEGVIGRIRIATSNGGLLDISNDHSTGKPDYTTDLSENDSLLGIHGRADWAIDSLYFITSKRRFRSQSIVDMTFT